MNRRLASLAAVLLLQLAAVNAAAQPICHDIHHWYVETRWGTFEFRESEIEPGGFRYSYITLGSVGRFDINPTALVAGSLTLLVAVTALTVLTVAIWRGKRQRLKVSAETRR